MRFLMDMIMPPLKSNKDTATVSPVTTEPAATELVAVNLTTNNNKYTYASFKYAPKVVRNLGALRRDSHFCDVELVAGETRVSAHRAVLAAASPYFHAMFTGGLCEQQRNSVQLHGVSGRALTLLLEFTYSGELQLDRDNVQEVIVAADMLELRELVDGCTEFLVRELHPSNALGILTFAEAHNCGQLACAAADFVHAHFPLVAREDEWLEAGHTRLAALLSSERLRVDSELQVFEAALRWVSHDAAARRRHVFDVLRAVRLPLLSPRLLARAAADAADGSLRVALRSVHADLAARRGLLVPLAATPRARAKKTIYVVGGSQREPARWHRHSESSFSSVVRYDTFRREWTATAPMAVSRILPGVAALDGCVFVVGGEQESRILAGGERYDPLEDRWTQIAGMAQPRCEFGLCALDGRLYALGGWVGQDIGGTVERYDPLADCWAPHAPLPEPRFSMGVVAYGGLVYVVGGCSQHQRHLHDLSSYDPDTGAWRRLPPMAVARAQMGVAVLYDCLYVVGGTGRSGELLASVERYSFQQNRWSTVPSMRVARAVPAVAAADGLLYVMGGDRTHDVNFYRAQVTLASVECYDPLADEWRDCPSLPESRSEAGAVVL